MRVTPVRLGRLRRIRRLAFAVALVSCALAATAQGCAKSGPSDPPDASSCTTGTQCKLDGGQTGCGQNQTSCPNGDGGTTCVNLQNDDRHCGSCKTSCSPNVETCSNGKCASTCGAKTVCIPEADAGDAGAAHCADLQNDPTDCSKCFGACLQGYLCQSAKCVSPILGSGRPADPWGTATPLANCSDYHKLVPSSRDGVYVTHPQSSDIHVYCDMTDGGVTYEDVGFGEYDKTYPSYTIVGTSDFTASLIFDDAFAFLYTQNGGLTNLEPSNGVDAGTWKVNNCCILNHAALDGGTTLIGLAGASYMQPSTSGPDGGVESCLQYYPQSIVQLWPMPDGPALATMTQAQAASAVASPNTCATFSNPGLFVKRY